MNEELVQYQPGRTLTPIMDLALAKSRLAEFQKFVREYMVEGEDYGLIPGTQKKTLYKPGADKLCELYGLNDSYRIIDRLVDFDRGLFDYEIECSLSRDGQPVTTGLGSCSSFEGKYRWRDSKYKCPACTKETIIKGKEEYGGGWLCFQKKGGCGAKFDAADQAIIGQVMGQVENDDIATLKNTILKVGKKRAKVDAVLAATRSSGVFTQDIGDDEGQGKPKTTTVQQPQRKSASAPTPNGNPPTEATGDLISKPQISRLWAISFDKKLSKEKTVEILAAFGFAHADKVTKAAYDKVIAAIEAGRAPTDDGDPGPQTPTI